MQILEHTASRYLNSNYICAVFTEIHHAVADQLRAIAEIKCGVTIDTRAPTSALTVNNRAVVNVDDAVSVNTNDKIHRAVKVCLMPRNGQF